VFTLALSGQPLDPQDWPCQIEENAGRIRAKWATPAGSLELSGLSKVGTIDEHMKSFGEKINSQDVPIVRLEDSNP
jgi:hypothetical protein